MLARAKPTNKNTISSTQTSTFLSFSSFPYHFQRHYSLLSLSLQLETSSNGELKPPIILSKHQIQRTKRIQRSRSLLYSFCPCLYIISICICIFRVVHIIVCSLSSNAYVPVRKRSFISNAASDIIEIGAVAVEHCGDETPPLAISFCKV